MKNLIKSFTSLALILFSLNIYAADNFKPAPDFSLKDASGKTHTLKSYAGKPLIIQFWATWCPYCKKLQPGLNKIYHKFTDKNGVHKVQVIGISFDEEKNAQPALVLKQRGIDFPTLLNGEQVAKAYGVQGTPTTFFIDKNGRLLGKTTTSNPEDKKLHLAARALAKL
ncbi:TlpA family protein disulfide reductase [Shewanella sp. 202IG2-18]|uniref:peroxiredoxin family protein n=1 Tax=Parashewanella hymeniacidonis TaxID=2807618 RepID=UPI00195F5550|nr:TlpA disulfide reductase family protein [Parashewanella hymeniacidonis]MBM7074472.1 TlpA family protein disulfide reductase [Parashewanella hymeniacidonis]